MIGKRIMKPDCMMSMETLFTVPYFPLPVVSMILEYMKLTGLSRTTATMELKAFRQDPASGITFVGRGSQKVYVKASEV